MLRSFYKRHKNKTRNFFFNINFYKVSLLLFFMKLENQLDVGYIPKPIEPKSSIFNPYRAILKKLATSDKKYPLLSKIGWGAFILLAPGSLVYNKLKTNSIRRELCEERNLDFTPFEFDAGDDAFCFMVEGVKTLIGMEVLAHYLS